MAFDLSKAEVSAGQEYIKYVETPDNIMAELLLLGKTCATCLNFCKEHKVCSSWEEDIMAKEAASMQQYLDQKERELKIATAKTEQALMSMSEIYGLKSFR